LQVVAVEQVVQEVIQVQLFLVEQVAVEQEMILNPL
tara:strand:- start:111 stop:218 length:108 start_codon:yes stop_codon:yes gene_type:complete